MAVAIKLKAVNIQRIRKALEKRADRLDKELTPTAKRINLVILGMIQKRFTSSNPGKWKPLSMFTRFVKRFRASKKTKNPTPLNDTGRLRNSNFPFVRQGGKVFGVTNNVRYAGVQNFGGKSKANIVRIGAHTRKSKTGNTFRVKPFDMKISGGHTIPPRPFFPTRKEFEPAVSKAIRAYVARTAGPNA